MGGAVQSNLKGPLSGGHTNEKVTNMKVERNWHRVIKSLFEHASAFSCKLITIDFSCPVIKRIQFSPLHPPPKVTREICRSLPSTTRVELGHSHKIIGLGIKVGEFTKMIFITPM